MRTDENTKKIVADGTSVFNIVFDTNTTEEYFEHKHFGNPYITETPFLIEYADGKPIAMRWMMGMDMVYCGQKLKAVQSSDDAALAEHRGLTFIKIRKLSEKIMKANGTDFVYGCFYPGHAMDIAEKLGEKNIVTLYTARLPLNDTYYRWKRFNIPLLKFIIKAKTANITKKLKNLSNLYDCEVTISDNCPFTETDFSLINSDNCLRVTRSAIYYDWKRGLRDSKNMKFVTARRSGNLIGFVVLIIGETHDTIADWDIFSTEENSDKILASLILKASTGKSIVAPALNSENREFKLFTSIGFKDARLHEAPICICVKEFNTEISTIIANPQNWKYRLIDADYFLN